MSITSEQITNQTFPRVRKGYDPAAVDRFLRRVAEATGDLAGGPLADVGATREQIIAEATKEAQQRLREADDAVAAALAERDHLQREVEQVRAEVDALAQQRSDVAAAIDTQAEEARARAQEAADEVLARAHADAEALRAEATEELEAARADRWEEIGARVTRILGQAEEEAAGIVAEATSQAEALTDAARHEARRTEEAADTDAADVRRRAEEWARAHLTAARDDLERLRAEESAAATTLEELVATAQRTLEDRTPTAPFDLGRAEELVAPFDDGAGSDQTEVVDLDRDEREAANV